MPGTDEILLPCHAGDPDLWFAETPSDLERAKTLCGDCPIRRQCLRAALDRAEPPLPGPDHAPPAEGRAGRVKNQKPPFSVCVCTGGQLQALN